jgi:hypothetical protein
VTDLSKFNEQQQGIARRAAEVRRFASDPQFEGGQFIKDPDLRAESLINAASEVSMFEGLSTDDTSTIATAWGGAIRNYVNIHSTMPPDGLLANASQALENVLLRADGKSNGSKTASGMMLEGLGQSLSQSDGVEQRAMFAAMILPVALGAATADACTFVPCERDEVEIFEIFNVAGSNSGDFKSGERLTMQSTGNFSQMRRNYVFPAGEQPDGAKKVFTFDGAAVPRCGKVQFKPGRVFLVIDRKKADVDKNGRITTYHEQTKTTFNAVVDYVAAKVVVTADTVLPAGVELAIDFEIDVEKAPEFIPVINHEMTSFKLYTSQSVIAAEHTIQALYAMRREYGIDMGNLNGSAMRDWMAHEVDMLRIGRMAWHCRNETFFDLAQPSTQSFNDWMYLLKAKIAQVSGSILEKTLAVGMTGAFVGQELATQLKSLRADMFEPAPNYRQTPYIHYIGKLFGIYKLYEVPNKICEAFSRYDLQFGNSDMLCYGRGDSISQAGFISGTAVPPIPFNHPTTPALNNRSTLWSLGIDDIHPRNGADYFMWLRVTYDKIDGIDHNTGLVNTAPEKPVEPEEPQE